MNRTVRADRALAIASLAATSETDMICVVTDRLMGRHQCRVEAVREALIDKIRNGLLRPGDRFVSARALSQRHSISYQTADRVLSQQDIEWCSSTIGQIPPSARPPPETSTASESTIWSAARWQQIFCFTARSLTPLQRWACWPDLGTTAEASSASTASAHVSFASA